MGLNNIKINNTTNVKTGVVYDISKATGQSYETLADALSGNNVPLEIREGGMSVRFVTSDNKYVQYRLMIQTFVTDTTQWQGVDDEPTAGSRNLVESGGVYNSTPTVLQSSAESDLDISDEHGNVLVRCSNGHIKTKEFDSRDIKVNFKDVPSNVDIIDSVDNIDFAISDEQGNAILELKEGHIKTKEFDSKNVNATLLNGKTLSIMGDSISTFQGMIPTGYSTQYPSGDVNTYDKTWWGKLIANEGMVLQVNNSWAGSVVSNTSTTGQVCMSDDSRLNNLGTNPDFILFFGGTNDFGYTANAAQLGEFDFDKEQEGGLDRTKFRQAVQYCVQQIQKLYPKSQLMIMLPLQRARYNEYGVIIQDYPAKNSLGIYEFEYRDVLKEAADIFGVPVIDTNKCGITFYNGTNNPSSSGGQSLYTIDGVHPNAAGMNLIYRIVKNKLLKYI